MLDEEKIHQIAEQVVLANLGPQRYVKSIIASRLDSKGRDAVQVDIFLTAGSSASVSGHVANSTIYDLNKKLQEAGEDRFPIVRWHE
jgi:hypothetical protein